MLDIDRSSLDDDLLLGHRLPEAGHGGDTGHDRWRLSARESSGRSQVSSTGGRPFLSRDRALDWPCLGTLEDAVPSDSAPTKRKLAIDHDPLEGGPAVGSSEAPGHLPDPLRALYVAYSKTMGPVRRGVVPIPLASRMEVFSDGPAKEMTLGIDKRRQSESNAGVVWYFTQPSAHQGGRRRRRYQGAWRLHRPRRGRRPRAPSPAIVLSRTSVDRRGWAGQAEARPRRPRAPRSGPAPQVRRGACDVGDREAARWSRVTGRRRSDSSVDRSIAAIRHHCNRRSVDAPERRAARGPG